jgi:hypothetical protein
VLAALASLLAALAGILGLLAGLLTATLLLAGALLPALLLLVIATLLLTRVLWILAHVYTPVAQPLTGDGAGQSLRRLERLSPNFPMPGRLTIVKRLNVVGIRMVPDNIHRCFHMRPLRPTMSRLCLNDGSRNSFSHFAAQNAAGRALYALVRSIMIDKRRAGRANSNVLDRAEDNIVARHRPDLHHPAIERDDG